MCIAVSISSARFLIVPKDILKKSGFTPLETRFLTILFRVNPVRDRVSNGVKKAQNPALDLRNRV
jgi:hypothetical protein